METVQLLDDFSVFVNLKTGHRHLRIPLLDINDAFVNEHIVDQNALLVTSGVWGIGSLLYIPPDGPGDKGQVWMREIKPFQVSSVDVDYFKECRSRLKHVCLHPMTT